MGYLRAGESNKVSAIHTSVDLISRDNVIRVHRSLWGRGSQSRFGMAKAVFADFGRQFPFRAEAEHTAVAALRNPAVGEFFAAFLKYPAFRSNSNGYTLHLHSRANSFVDMPCANTALRGILRGLR